MRVVTAAATDDDDPLVLGSIYEAVCRKYYGWDFALIEGEGPVSLRILNSQVLTYLEPLGRARGGDSVFDFDHWCSWTDAQCRQVPADGLLLDFKLGDPSAKRGAAVTFKATQKIMQLAFWETGEADFYGMDLLSGGNIAGFDGRILDDRSFEQTFRECMLVAASS